MPVEVYDNLYRDFAPEQFSAKEWADIIVASGAKYIIFLTKHHDGFCMFDSQYTDYKVTRSPLKRDVTAEVAAACHGTAFSASNSSIRKATHGKPSTKAPPWANSTSSSPR